MPVFDQATQTPPEAKQEAVIAIVKPPVPAVDPTDLLKSTLEKAGYAVSVWNDVNQAQRYLLKEAEQAARTNRMVIVIVIDEILPDESEWVHVVDNIAYYRDAFVRWLYSALMIYPCVIHVYTDTALAPFETQAEYEAYADDWVDKCSKETPTRTICWNVSSVGMARRKPGFNGKR